MVRNAGVMHMNVVVRGDLNMNKKDSVVVGRCKRAIDGNMYKEVPWERGASR